MKPKMPAVLPPKIAFIFPGQASQYVGMGEDFFNNYSEARRLFAQADQALGFELSQLCFAGPPEDLTLTYNTQPAILTVSIVAACLLAKNGIKPSFLAGHSLGEYSALVAGGALPFQEALNLVYHRGKYMQDAVPVGQGAMAAIMGLSLSQLEEICQEIAKEKGEIVSPANINSSQQIVISGHTAAVKRCIEAAKQAGSKKAILLPVSAPFHCALMKPAADKLQPELSKASISNLEVPLATNISGNFIKEAEAIREALIKQITYPVRWVDCLQTILSAEWKPDLFLEVGPGKILSGLLKRIDGNAACLNVEDSESLQIALEYINKMQN